MQTTTYPTPHGVALDLRIPAGSIDVDLDATGETVLEIDGEKDERDLRIRFVEGTADGAARLEVEHRKGTFGFARDLDVRIHAPVGATVDVQTGSGDLTVRGTANGVAFRSGSGDLRTDDVEGPLMAQTGSGDVQIGDVAGSCRVSAASGDLRAGRVGGELSARSASGDVQARAAAGDADVSTASGDIEIDAVSSGEVRVHSVSGDATIGVAAGTGVWLDVSSTSGSVVSELAGGDEATAAVAVRLKVSTVSGDVRIRRAG